MFCFNLLFSTACMTWSSYNFISNC
jgi:hypothetical protein